MQLVELEEARTCVVYKASVEIRKVLDAARNACVLDLVFEFTPVLREILRDVGENYGMLVQCYPDLSDDEIDALLSKTTPDA